MLTIELIPLLKDNYAFLLIDSTGTTAIIDPGESDPVIETLNEKNIGLDFIINTHHHWDHTDGNNALKAHYNCQIVAPEADAYRIDGVDIGLKENDIFSFGSSQAKTFETPGHTLGHICLWFESHKALFTGDTLFSMGTGRLFEGTAEHLWNSLNKIKALPDDTMIYCGHEYTALNGRFCQKQEPENEAIKARMAEVRTLRHARLPTIPVSLRTEKDTNCLLRAKSVQELANLRDLKETA